MIDVDDREITERRRPTLPGDILRHEVLQGNSITQEMLADAMGVSRYSINQLVNGRRTVTTEMALRLSIATSTTAEFWLDLQRKVDLYEARVELKRELDRVKIVVPPMEEDDIFTDLPMIGER